MEKSQDLLVASGVYAALATPRLHGKVEPDAAAFLDYIDRVVNGGVNGLVFFGSTGEFVHFVPDDRMRTASLGIKRSRVPVLVNVSHSTLAGTLELGRHAVDIGAAGVLVMPPYFYRYDDGEIARFFDEFLGVMGGTVSLYLYDLPRFTNPISQELAGRLLAAGAFAGIKDSSGDWGNFEELRRLRKEHRFQLMIGNELIYVRALSQGADGIVSGVAAALPELPVAMNRAKESADLAGFQNLAVYMNDFMAWVAKFPAPIVVKQTAELRGWMKADPFVPLGEKAGAEMLAFCKWFEEWLPSALAACSSTIGVRT